VKILWRLGEERSARAIARRIVRERDLAPIEDTERLAELVSAVKGGRRGRRHPATKTFMALRMAVNTELESLRLGLEAGLKLLAVGGRFSVISFHRAHVGCNESLQAGGSCWVGETPPVRLVRKKPILPGGVEIGENPRARSAKLRIAERIG
jgi:16S rRNA (cytosine1402-N4)-methyltransferase